MSIHDHLPPEVRKDLRAIGWTKGRELEKLARAEGQRFDCATWVHKARSMPRETFRREVEKELTGKEEEPAELIYFKGKPPQQAIEGLMTRAAKLALHSKRRGRTFYGYCSLAYSALASFRMGRSGSASFQRVRKSW